MEGIEELDRESFEEVITRCEELVIVEFYTNSCPNCRAMGPIYAKLANEMGGKARFCRVNAQVHMELGMLYGVRAVPTFMFFCHKRPIGSLVGGVNETVLRNTIVDHAQHRQVCVTGSSPLSYDMTGYM